MAEQRPDTTPWPGCGLGRRPAAGASPLQKEQARRLLPALIARMCLEVYDRDWVTELPYTLWERVTGATTGPKEFRAEEIALFRILAQVADGWIRYDEAEGPMFISRRRWLHDYSAWKRNRSRIRKSHFYGLHPACSPGWA